MSNVLSVITTDTIVTMRSAWVQKMSELQQQLHRLHDEATKIQVAAEKLRDEMKALDGAIQASDVFLRAASGPADDEQTPAAAESDEQSDSGVEG